MCWKIQVVGFRGLMLHKIKGNIIWLFFFVIGHVSNGTALIMTYFRSFECVSLAKKRKLDWSGEMSIALTLAHEIIR